MTTTARVLLAVLLVALAGCSSDSGGAGDTAVVPPTSERLRGATNFQLRDVCPTLSIMHSEIPDDPTVEAIVLAELDTTPAGRPSPDVCTAPAAP